MKKIISLIVLFALAGCVGTSTNNTALSPAQLEQCKTLGQRVIAQDEGFQPALSISSLVRNELPVIAEDFQNGVLTCSLPSISDGGYAIAYAERSDVLLHQKYSGDNKAEVLKLLTKEVSIVEQRLQNLERAEKLREESAKKQREAQVKREAAKNKQITFCMDFGEKYSDILKVHGMTVRKVSVSDSWDSGESITCENNYDVNWVEEDKSEVIQEQHVINKATGEYQTIFR